MENLVLQVNRVNLEDLERMVKMDRQGQLVHAVPDQLVLQVKEVLKDVLVNLVERLDLLVLLDLQE